MRKSYKNSIIGILILAVLFLSTGYAYLTTSLSISGTAITKGNTWNIYFDNIQVDSGSVEADDPEINTAKDTVTYSLTLPLPGDYYKFDVDIVNGGTIDGMVNVITNPTLTTAQQKYFEFSATYSDGIDISKNDLLAAGSTETIELTVKYKDDITSSDLPDSDQTINITFGITYLQADDSAVEVNHDELLVFINKAKSGNITSADLGSTFEIDMGDYGTHTLRVANTSTPSECKSEGFSQTACGVVLEFVDVISYNNSMNSTSTNVGGYPASEMRTFVNTDIYNAIPENIRKKIIDTTVISSHGLTSGETNFTSTDKVYLLSTHEVYSDVDGSTTSGIDYNDTSYNYTRQLDYYANLGVTTSNLTGSIKKYNGYAAHWWLRSAAYNSSSNFFMIANSGTWSYYLAATTIGVSPAFRIS